MTGGFSMLGFSLGLTANTGGGGGLSAAQKARAQKIVDAANGYSGAPAVMASPPTITTGTAFAASTINSATTAAPSNLITSTAKFARLFPLSAGPTYYLPAYATWNSGRTSGGTSVYRFKNTASATTFDIMMRGFGAATFMLKIGGQWISASNTSVTLSGDHYIKFVFGSAIPADTEWELLIGGNPFIAGMNCSAGAIVASTNAAPIMEVWGDSYVAGGYPGAADYNASFGYVLGQIMGSRSLLQGRGGQGYFDQIDGRTINGRMVLDAGFAQTDPDLGVAMNSVNDRGDDLPTILTNTTAGIKQLQTVYPNSLIAFAVGLNTATSPQPDAAMDAILATAMAAKDERTFVIDGRAWPKVVGPDGVHPTSAERDDLTGRLKTAIVSQLVTAIAA